MTDWSGNYSAYTGVITIYFYGALRSSNGQCWTDVLFFVYNIRKSVTSRYLEKSLLQNLCVPGMSEVYYFIYQN